MADAFAANVLPIVRQIEASGVKGYRAIAAALNASGIRTARGGEWHNTTIRNLVARDTAWKDRSGHVCFERIHPCNADRRLNEPIKEMPQVVARRAVSSRYAVT